MDKTNEDTQNGLIHFTPEMIPEPIQKWVLDCCAHAEGSLNYGAVSAIVLISNIIGFRCKIKPKQYSDWLVTPNLWGMLIGNPSSRKSPVLDQIMKPLFELEFNSRKNVKPLNKQSDTANNLNQIEDRFIINDATTEAIGNIMSTNKRTLLQYRDELSGLFSSFKKAGHQGDRSFYLESFTGDKPYTYDRIGRGTIHIDCLSMGLIGTIQPNILSRYILDTEDGLAQRMQLSVFPNDKFLSYTDEPIDIDAKIKAYEIIKKLAYADFKELGGQTSLNNSSIYFTFTHQSQKIFIEWYKTLKLHESREENINMQAHIGKYYSLLPSLALTFFLISKINGDTSSNEIEVEHIKRAIQWCQVLESHARKMYQLGKKESNISLKNKIINFIKNNPQKLPASFGALAGDIRGANAQDIEIALKDIAKIEGKTVIELRDDFSKTKKSKPINNSVRTWIRHLANFPMSHKKS